MIKADLRNYVSKLVENKMDVVRERQHEISEHIAGVAVEKFKTESDVTIIEEKAEELAALLEKNIDKMPYSDYQVGGIRTAFTGIVEDYTYDARNEVNRAIRMNEFVRDHKMCGIDVSDLFKEFEEEIKQLREQAARLGKLQSEMNTIINVEPTAKRAYKALVAAGVDMTGFTESPANNLPAVVKLSVDPSILKEEVQ